MNTHDNKVDDDKCDDNSDDNNDNIEKRLNFLAMRQIDDGYADHLLRNLQQLNHASVISGMVRLPHVKHIRLESCLFDTGRICMQLLNICHVYEII